jgi:hypothetical protein
MSVVLAVEPDRRQAEILRRVFADVPDTKLVIVTSLYAAVVVINREVPDVVVMSDALESKAQEDVRARLQAMCGSKVPQIIPLPRLRDGDGASSEKTGWFRSSAAASKKTADPAAFRSLMTSALARAASDRRDRAAQEEQQRSSRPSVPATPPAPPPPSPVNAPPPEAPFVVPQPIVAPVAVAEEKVEIEDPPQVEVEASLPEPPGPSPGRGRARRPGRRNRSGVAAGRGGARSAGRATAACVPRHVSATPEAVIACTGQTGGVEG